MKANVGSADRVFRVIIGLVILSYLFIGEGSARYFSLIGLVPLLTAAIGYCPIDSIVGMTTCGLKR